jgi:hypothetical protein
VSEPPENLFRFSAQWAVHAEDKGLRIWLLMGDSEPVKSALISWCRAAEYDDWLRKMRSELRVPFRLRLRAACEAPGLRHERPSLIGRLAARLGVTYMGVYHWTRQHSFPLPEQVRIIADELGWDPDMAVLDLQDEIKAWEAEHRSGQRGTRWGRHRKT